jgi:hypothetical protein
LKDELRTLKEDKKKLENNCNNLKRRVQEVWRVLSWSWK